MKKYKDVFDDFINNEIISGIFNLKIKGKIPVWPYCRNYIFNRILKNEKVFDQISSSPKTIKIKYLFKALLKGLDFTKIINNKDILIIPSDRYKSTSDIYTLSIRTKYDKNYCCWAFSEKKQYSENYFYLDIWKYLFYSVSYLVSFVTKSPKEVKELDSNYSCDLKAPIKLRLIEFRLWFFLYYLLLKLKRPKKIFIISGISFAPLVAAADLLNIKTYEIQHGVISPYSISYSYPQNMKRDYFFSNFLCLFSGYWINKSRLPFGVEQIVIGNNFFHKKTKERNQEPTILIVSQKTIANSLIQFIYQRMDELKDYSIVYKLHPTEYKDYEDNYPLLFEIKRKLNKFKIVTNEYSMNYLLESNNICIASYSLAIYEALDYGCKVLVVNTNGLEIIDDLINSSFVRVLKDNETLSFAINQINTTKAPLFFEIENDNY